MEIHDIFKISGGAKLNNFTADYLHHTTQTMDLTHASLHHFNPLVVRGWELRGWERKNINAQSGVASRLHSLALLLSIWDSQ